MQMDDLVEFAQAWSELGNVVTDQVVDVLDNSDTDGVNINAINEAYNRLRNFKGMEPSDEIVSALKEYLNKRKDT